MFFIDVVRTAFTLLTALKSTSLKVIAAKGPSNLIFSVFHPASLEIGKVSGSRSEAFIAFRYVGVKTNIL
jgi:hypothetical protein